MSAKYVAGVDSSTQSCKLVIFDPKTGEIVREASAPHPDGTEVDPRAWWDAFEQCAGRLGLADVAALSVAGQQHGMVCLDKNGEVLRPALLWNDTRSARQAEQLVELKGAPWWAEAIGSVPVASLTVTKLAWVKENEGEIAAKIAAVCLPHDYLTWRISGSSDIHDLCTDRSDASGTGYFDATNNCYRYDILALALGITEAQARDIVLPKVLGPTESAGWGDSARGWGDILLGPGCGDNAGAALGIGLETGDGLLSLGTSGVVSAISPRPIIDGSGSVTCFADASGEFLPLVCTLNASRILDAIKNLLGVSYEQLDQLALQASDTGGLELEPYFDGERTPNLPDATGTLRGMTLANCTPAYLAHAAVDGLLRHMRAALGAISDQGMELKSLRVIGGGARSDAVRQLATKYFDCPVTFPPTREYVAIGAAKQAAMVLQDSKSNSRN